MAKYSRFDARNKKKTNDKYRSDRKSPKNTSGTRSATKEGLNQLQRSYNAR